MTPVISRILVPLDYSAHSQRALEYATALAARVGASLHLVNVVEPIPMAAMGGEMYTANLPEILDAMVADAKRLMADCVDGLPPGTTVSNEVTIGQPASSIAEIAAAHRCDLIVMGTHGRTGLAHLFLGSVAERVTRLAPCPVLTVRPLAWAAGQTRRAATAA